MDSLQYIHLPPSASLEGLNITAPFAAVVTIDAQVTPEWRHKVSEWFVESGCVYMMAHGDECSLWDDSVDWANLEAHNWDIPEDKFIMTTWHEDESLQEVFDFAISSVPLSLTIEHMIILDISEVSREIEISKYYKAAEAEYSGDAITYNNSWDISADILGGIIGFVALPFLLIFILINFF